MSKKAPKTKPRTRDANGFLMADDGLQALMTRAVAAANRRSKELDA